MLRPTLAETLSGMQRTILQTLLPELTSPYAQQQATMLTADLAHIAASLEKVSAYDAAEIVDLKETLSGLEPLAAKVPPKLRPALETGIRAAKASPPDRRAMEAAIAEFAAALAVGQLEEPVADRVRGYLRRYLERARALLQSPWGA